MMSNSTAIAELYSRIDHKFDLMYAVPSSTGTSAPSRPRARARRRARSTRLATSRTRHGALEEEPMSVRDFAPSPRAHPVDVLDARCATMMRVPRDGGDIEK